MAARILLIDDDPIVILLQRKLMEKAGYTGEILTFDGGDKAIDYLTSPAAENGDYLLFLDINMPKMTGWQVMDRLLETKPNIKYWVVIITSSIEQSEQDKSKEYAAIVDFWIKPFSLESFLVLKERPELTKFV